MQTASGEGLEELTEGSTQSGALVAQPGMQIWPWRLGMGAAGKPPPAPGRPPGTWGSGRAAMPLARARMAVRVIFILSGSDEEL